MGRLVHECFSSDLRTALGGQLKSKKGKEVSGTLWPNGEFSYAYVPENLQEAWECEADEYLYSRKDKQWKGARPLDSSLLRNSATDSEPGSEGAPRGRYGLKGMTGEARKRVRSSAYLLQERFAKERLSFLTLTLPPLEGVSLEKEVASRWPDAVHHFLKRLKRLLLKRQLPPFVLGVTELRLKRYERLGQLPLHLHVVFPGRKRKTGPWSIAPFEFRKMWKEVLENILGIAVYDKALENVQQVKSSAEGYLGKYMSKSRNEVEKVLEDGNEWMLPRQWWFSSKEVKDFLKQRLKRGRRTGVLLESVVNEVLEGRELPPGIWIHRISIDLDGFDYTAGWVGKVPRDICDDLFSMLDSSM